VGLLLIQRMPERSSFDLDRLRAGLKPFRLHFFTTLRSTNDHAAVLRRRGDLYAPAVVLAARQTAGRGRGANTWFSAAGSLTVTFVVAENETFAPHHLPLAAGLAARNAAAELTANDDVQLKWPNDLVVPSAATGGSGLPLRRKPAPLRKLAGLLCERLDNIDLVGIGLNVNRPATPIPKDIRDRVIHLQQLRRNDADQPFDLTTVLVTLARHLHTTLVQQPDTPFPVFLREYDRHHALVGRTVTVRSPHEPPISGVCQGLDDTGRLLLRDGKTSHRIIAGHVETA
jgi:BirA family biotin operon repressor/biotin-[acetyl-CoA-carboxylase] ligase